MAINYGKLNAKLTPRGSLKATMDVSGPLNSDYEPLINKPQINGNELIGDKSNADLGIPTALEDLTDDSTHRVVTDEQIDAWDNKSDFSGSYNDLKDVPVNLVQDANYVHTDNNYDDTAKNAVDALGTASTYDVPESGNASTSQVVKGDDTRLTDDRNAKDVYSWAKASTKPSYTATEVGAIASTLKGTANGVAELDANGKVPSAQLPSYVDDVLEYASTSAFPQTGESGKIYIALDTNKTYRWGGSAYVEISESLALGETDSTAYAGNKGKQNADNIATIQSLIPSSATTSNKLATANDIPDISGKADKSEMSVSTSNDLTTIQLKSGTSATVINAHQDISGKANKSEMSVSTSGDKTTIQLKSGTSAEVLNQHQDISGKVDKVQGKGLSTNDYDDTAKGIVDGVTSALAGKVDKVTGKGLSTNDYTTEEKTKLAGISEGANKVESSETNGNIIVDGTEVTVYDDTEVQNDIDAIEDELSTDSATIEGNPLNFSTLSAQKSKSTILSLDPIQDLHGFTKPWVGGAGKNKLSVNSRTLSGADNVLPNTPIILSPGTYTLAFTVSTVSSGALADLKVKDANNEVIAQHYIRLSAGRITQTFTISTSSAAVLLYANNTVAANYTDMQIESGSSATSYEPYSNICPISGHDQINVLGCGKNLIDVSTKGMYDVNGQGTMRAGYAPIKLDVGTYTFSYKNNLTSQQTYVTNITDDYSWTQVNDSLKYLTFTLDKKSEILIRSSSTELLLEEPQLEKSNEKTTYSPYTPSNNLTISFGQTVYGGQVDVEKGLLVVDRTSVDLSNYTWTQLSGYIVSTQDIPNIKYVTSNTEMGNGLSENYQMHTATGMTLAFGCIAIDVDKVSVNMGDSTYQASGQFVYELATPITINLTPNAINLLKGVNNISTDGDNITLTYREGEVATLGDLKEQIAESQILTDTATGDKYILVVTNGVLSVEQISN